MATKQTQKEKQSLIKDIIKISTLTKEQVKEARDEIKKENTKLVKKLDKLKNEMIKIGEDLRRLEDVEKLLPKYQMEDEEIKKLLNVLLEGQLQNNFITWDMNLIKEKGLYIEFNYEDIMTLENVSGKEVKIETIQHIGVEVLSNHTKPTYLINDSLKVEVCHYNHRDIRGNDYGATREQKEARIKHFMNIFIEAGFDVKKIK